MCVPLGLAWIIRCFIKFGITPNYALDLGSGSDQYVGNASLWERIGIPKLSLLTTYGMYDLDVDKNSNIWRQTFFSMNFDEALPTINSDSGHIFAATMMVISIVVILCLFILMVKGICDRSVNLELKLLFGIGWLTVFGFYINFTFKYQQMCTMNFRYIVPTIIFLCAGAGLGLEHMSGKRWISVGLQSLIYLYAVMASLLFLIFL